MTNLPNIINIEAVDALANQLGASFERPESRRWFQRNVRNFLCRQVCLVRPVEVSELPGLRAIEDAVRMPDWIQRNVATGQKLYWFDPIGRDSAEGRELFAAIRLMSDWMKALPDEDRRWRQFDKMSVPTAIGLAKAWRTAFLADSPHETKIAEYAYGYRVVQLNTEVAMRREGKRMHHCVGDKRYSELVKAGELKIYSVRDRNDQPHLTLAVVQPATGGWVQQVKGRHDSHPDERWRPLINRFAADRRLRPPGYLAPSGRWLRRLSEAVASANPRRSISDASSGECSAAAGPLEFSVVLTACMDTIEIEQRKWT